MKLADPKLETKTISVTSMIGFILAALAIPAIPFALFGWWLEPQLESLIQSSWLQDHLWASAGLIVSVLASDILLPIPSSAVCTFSGNVLGSVVGTLTNWVGLNAAALVGYFLGVRFGMPIANRFCKPETLKRMDELVARYGLWAVVICRAVPLLAEATMLVVGVYRKSSIAFWGATFAANLGIAMAYAILGKFAGENGWFSLAMAISISVPIALLLIGWSKQKKLANEN